MTELLGRIVNATTLDGRLVQGRLIYAGRRGWGRRPDQQVAVVAGQKSHRGCTFICDPRTVREPPKIEIRISIGDKDAKDALHAARIRRLERDV